MTQELSANAKHILDYLARVPLGKITATHKTTQEVLLYTDTSLMARGTLYEIVATSVGAGVYRLELKEWKHKT